MKKLFWLDLEMTGLNPNSDRVLEACAVITNWNFEVQETWNSALYQPVEALALMDEWCQKTHSASGLLTRVAQGITEHSADMELCSLVSKHFSSDERIVLCGNSIGQDRKFVDNYFPLFSKKLHYRMLDVSSFKIVFEHKYGQRFEKKNKHTAEEDVLESISELKHYLGYFNSSSL